MAGPIVVIGSSNADFIMKMDRLPSQGETVTNAQFLQSFGGRGANQAVSAARAGGNVYFVNCVGDDVYGALIRQNLRAAGVNVDYVRVQTGAASGAALVMVDGSGEKYLSIAPGANSHLTPDCIQEINGLLRGAEMIVLQCEIPGDTLARAISVAFHLGKKILLNLAPAMPIDPALLRYLYTLVVNENGAEFLVGYPVDSPEGARSAARDLLARGPLYAIVTLGAKGAYIAGPDLDEVVDARSADLSAASDVFCGSLAAALVEGRPMAEAARFAGAAAAISVTRPGAQPSAPGREEIDALLATSI